MSSRVKGAIMVGIALVAGAFVLSRYTADEAPAATEAVVADAPEFLTESPLRRYIPTEDSNNDGIPDWQALLAETETIALPATSTPFTEPETLTDRFALEFFESYVRNEGFGAFAQPPEDIVNQASDELIAETQDTLFSETDILIVNGTPADITAHANAVATIIDRARVPAGTPNELAIVEQAVATNDAALLSGLQVIVDNYDAIITGMQAVPVPQAMVKEHLDLLNAAQAVRNDIAAMQNLFVDPLTALLRLQRYQDDVLGLGTSMVNLFEGAAQQGASFRSGDPVYAVYQF